MFRKAMSVIGAAALMLALWVAPARAAQSDCAIGRFCTWTNANYSGTRWTWDANTIAAQPGGCLNVTASANNNQSSLWANVGIIGYYLVIWDGAGCTGLYWRVSTNVSDSDLGVANPISGFDNRLTSISMRTTCC